MTQPAGPGVYTALHPQSPAASKLTILDGDLALPVIHPQHRFTLPPPLGHDANLPLAVIAVIGRVLAQGQSRLVCWRKEARASHTAVGNSHQERCTKWSLEQWRFSEFSESLQLLGIFSKMGVWESTFLRSSQVKPLLTHWAARLQTPLLGQNFQILNCITISHPNVPYLIFKVTPESASKWFI